METRLGMKLTSCIVPTDIQNKSAFMIIKLQLILSKMSGPSTQDDFPFRMALQCGIFR